LLNNASRASHAVFFASGKTQELTIGATKNIHLTIGKKRVTEKIFSPLFSASTDNCMLGRDSGSGGD
jgi:hypothetical protein